jgi:predicted dehydrogenase
MKKILYAMFVVFSGIANAKASELDICFQQDRPNIKIGAVGLGNHFTEKLLPALLDSGFKVVGGSRRDPIALEKMKNILHLDFTSEDYNDLLNPDLIDAVVVSGSSSLHEKVVRSCLNARIPVFSEKPLTLSLEAAKELRDLALANDVVASVGLNMIYIPSMELLKNKVNSLEQVEILCTIGAPIEDNEFKEMFKESLYSAFIHPLSFSINLMGAPNGIRTSLIKDEDEKKFELTVDLLYDGEPKQKIVFKNYQQGGFVFKVMYRDAVGDHLIDTTSKNSHFPNEKQESYKAEFKDFYDSILSKKQPRNNFEFNLIVQQVLELIIEDLAKDGS